MNRCTTAPEGAGTPFQRRRQIMHHPAVFNQIGRARRTADRHIVNLT